MSNPEALVMDPAMVEIGPAAATDEARFVDRAQSLSFTSEVVFRAGDFDQVKHAVHPQHFEA